MSATPVSDGGASLTPRVMELQIAVRSSMPGACTERARTVTAYFRRKTAKLLPMVVQKAEALAAILRNKTIRIHPGELLVGNFSSYRVGGNLYPELHGVAVLEDVFRFQRRKLNPLRLPLKDRLKLLLYVLPYWSTRFLALRAFALFDALRFIRHQMSSKDYFINESGGIAHFVPHYEKLVRLGCNGLLDEIRARRAEKTSPAEVEFLNAAGIAITALSDFAMRYSRHAELMSTSENDSRRGDELHKIAAVCRMVSEGPPRTFREALQLILFAQIAVNLESLDNGISPGRLDQILYPFFKSDLESGLLTRDEAFELLCCFSLKLCELVPVLSERISRFHTGLMSGQAVIIGGTDSEGRDVTNALTWMFLDVMEKLPVRQPNFHIRLHLGTPPDFRSAVTRVISRGAASPAVYNDSVIIDALQERGIPLEDARTYATVGCVEPTVPGVSFQSTDAALVNLPWCLERVMSQAEFSSCKDVGEVFQLYRLEVKSLVERLSGELHAIESANARWHPTPLSSVLIDDCVRNVQDATAGGARWNGSGVQGVGAVEVGNGLAAIHEVVFRSGRASLAEIRDACRTNFTSNEGLRNLLLTAPKFGNDNAEVDELVARVMLDFEETWKGRETHRRGNYAVGFYSMTCHEAFGSLIGALPSGRKARQPFSSGVSPSHGTDTNGPTALLRSVGSLPLRHAANGVNLNVQIEPWILTDDPDGACLGGLVAGAMAVGCMQMQFNVLDPAVLVDARDHPGKFPNLLVRISGYSAYYDDLSLAMKNEVIGRFTGHLPK